ncbi:hypothetical protein ASG19_08765 [Rhizobium sp. Leaf306]|nr:hypothetical protein ASG19_08765 [Rhizobium sp. Leaf306]
MCPAYIGRNPVAGESGRPVLDVATGVHVTPERRRERFEAVRNKAHSLGLQFEDDPTYLDAVEEWIAGSITAENLRNHYQELLEGREKEKRLSYFVKHCLQEV